MCSGVIKDGVKCFGEIEEHPHSDACFFPDDCSLKQVYDGVFNSNPMMIIKLQWVLEGARILIQVGQEKSFQGFHDVADWGNMPIV